MTGSAAQGGRLGGNPDAGAPEIGKVAMRGIVGVAGVEAPWPPHHTSISTLIIPG